MAKGILEKLGFKNVKILVDQTKARYIEELEDLKRQAMEFEENKVGKETLAIAIINIGSHIDPFQQNHKEILDSIGVAPGGKKIGDYEDFFELTREGEALNLNEYATYIADTRETTVQKAYIAKMMGPKSQGGQELSADKVVFKSSVHVIVMDDFYSKKGILFNQHVKSTREEFEELKLVDGKANPDRFGRNNVSFFPNCNMKGFS